MFRFGNRGSDADVRGRLGWESSRVSGRVKFPLTRTLLGPELTDNSLELSFSVASN